ncbi:MarR family transcriptional regulator [Halorhabdus sp. CBA1104]|uniref:MarR family transcriptional regulator n=1 Tax=Halorhabdus sp. CBA1104 TaxID=1380432 RepID=UPI0012B1E80F|nr:MarR family transcriptional regulator [Halorhabdus sp. CBA1104]QGN07943.1 MarR family transcriptional regulator [Halorhabdus sp. CBA1104]
MDDSRDHETFPVLPKTDEYEVLSFLVRNRGERFTLSEIAVHADVNEASAPETLHDLLEKNLVEHDQDDYYVDSDRAEDIKSRLKSVDAAKRLHETAPDDDIYAVTDWEEELNSS